MKKLLYELTLGRNETEIFDNVIHSTFNNTIIYKLVEKYMIDKAYHIYPREEWLLLKFTKEELDGKNHFPKVSLILELELELDEMDTLNNGEYYILNKNIREVIKEDRFEMLKLVIGKDRHYDVEVIKLPQNSDRREKETIRALVNRLNFYTDDMINDFEKELNATKEIYDKVCETTTK